VPVGEAQRSDGIQEVWGRERIFVPISRLKGRGRSTERGPYRRGDGWTQPARSLGKRRPVFVSRGSGG